MNAGTNFVEVQHRPRRIAFLVDVDQSPDTLFSEIVDFSVSSWGGRYNPIIPVFNGTIPESYWRLLNLTNPDILYSYCDLATSTLKKILNDIRPLDVRRHRQSSNVEEQAFRVGISRQATVLSILRKMSEGPFFMRAPSPAVLVFEYKDLGKVSTFARWNFGVSSNLHIRCENQGIPSIVMRPDNDEEIMKAVASNRNLVLPIHVSADAPREFKAVSALEGDAALTLFYGASLWNFVEYWNNVHFQDSVPTGAQPSISGLWVPPKLLTESSHHAALLGLIRRRVFNSHQSYLRLISYDEPADRMREVAKQICEGLRWNMHAAEPIVRTKGELPAFKAQRVVRVFVPKASRPRREQVFGTGSFLDLIPPTDALHDCDEEWIAEFTIENSQQERYFKNKGTWWKFPKKHGVAELVFPGTACRIGNDHLIGVEVSGRQQGLSLNTPDLGSLFSKLILSENAPDWAKRLDPAMRENPTASFYIRSSDKGRYARGVLGLFESLQKAAYVFEHGFWRGVIELLSSPVPSQHTQNKVRNDLERIMRDPLNSSSVLDLVLDEVLDAAGRIQRPTTYGNFAFFFDLYWKYVKALPKDERESEVTQTDYQRRPLTNDKDWSNAAHANLREMLSEMTARKVFLPGAKVQCDHCLASLWYHIDDLRSVVTCRGCRKEVNLPAEIPWSYALNELLVSAVRDHGVAPVIRTAYRLLENSRDCFCFLPGIEVRDYEADPETQVCELDLVWIRDGEFGIAEIKRTPKKFSLSKNLRLILSAAHPDRFLLVSTSGTGSQLEQARLDVASQLGPDVAVEAWSSDVLAASSHHGWNTSTYSVFP